MTLPATIALEVGDELSRKVGIALGVFPADETSSIEVQRAPDSAGSPNVGAAITATILPRGAEVFVDVLPKDGARRHYRIRHVARGADPSSWTPWVSAIPDVLPRRIVRPDPVAPVVARTRAVSGTTGTLTLAITDPQARVTLVEFRTKVGSGAYSSWTADGTVPYETTVTITPGQISLIGYRVTGYDGDGRSRILAEGEEGFDDSHLVQALAVVASFDEDGALKVRVIGDTHTGSIRVAVSTSSFPSSGTVGAATAVDGRQSEWSFPGPYTLGQAVYISALAYTGTGGGGTASDKIDSLVYRANSAVSKTIRLAGAAIFRPIDETLSYDLSNGYFRLNVFNTVQGMIPVPKGATLTAVRVRAYVANAGGSFADFLRLQLQRVGNDGAVTQLGSNVDYNAGAGGTWQTLTVGSLSEDTSGDRSYVMWGSFLGDGASHDNRIAWLEYDIDVPNVDVST
jgi:hypothetical protein